MYNKNLALKAPLNGPLLPLNRVPDPVFASNAMGEGIAIDPTSNRLHAPCAGVISHIARTRHAIGIRANNGVEILLHVGLDTVQLQGEGFSVLVEPGERVIEGQALLCFDLDRVAQRCKSLITVMVVNNAEGWQVRPMTTQTVTLGTPVLMLSPLDDTLERPEAQAQASVPQPQAQGHARVAHSGGLHARPAALLRKTAQGFSSSCELHFAGQQTSLDSLLGIMGLGVAEGEEVEVICRGADCQQALAALLDAIGTAHDSAPNLPPTSIALPVKAQPVAGSLSGVCASPGLVSGPLTLLGSIELSEDHGEHNPHEQHLALDQALQQVRRDVQANQVQAELRDDEAEAAIFAAHQALLEDPSLLDAADLLIDQGISAPHAWHRAIEAQRNILRSLNNPLLAERANDLSDLEKRILRVLLNQHDALQISPGAIVAAHEITPSDLGPLLESGVAGICMAEGGPTSHVAILARSRGLPCVVALGAQLLEQDSGQIMVLDAENGRLELSPNAQRLEQVLSYQQQRQARREQQQHHAHEPALTRDGVPIEIAANVASHHEASEALGNGADGVGLLRTEFLFIDRQYAPDETEQQAAYQSVLDAISPQPVIIRTIDVGGDKHLSYLPLPVEENPALGLRGIRLGQARPALLDQQLRALLKVKPLQRCRILLPMVSEVDELIAIRKRLEELAAELNISQLPQLGVMIEVPSAALLADQLALHADFFSIGTNDLSQYTLAMDRGHAGLAPRIDALHPALLRLIQQTCSAAAKHQRWVGVCGALASDTLATPVLIGLGVQELSVGPGLIGELKARVRTLDAADCRQRSQTLLSLSSAAQVREQCHSYWPLV
ncbi:phosphoenolpyruvate--protein phosphotransferase [Pseudomonas sp. 5P_3.1_Bac2]|uniref:phosphoenolpyruvate--protein phosphotransferase n=1 Tax=Pseudomonas sp. 5P_3.1_Bac2 TaxID=2971617 RepID=UPI0021C9E2A5|nr:phosphoenolpyruvate--protein phosphotransferase [Pseudomonas sp. 5P_3.1_Bac2]MCU1719598.1 phosphoenolpyruvate--protein phosphotransferase [Pseudomonas sp. 5P_3.1_Bac2]